MAKSNKLWTKTAWARIPALYATEHTPDTKRRALVKIFSNLSDHRHYVIEYNPETGIAFCLTTNQDVCEFGYVSIPELQELNDNFRQHRFICPPFQREFHGTPRGGYNIEKVQEAHSRQFNPEAWKANIADGRAEVIPV